MKYLKNIANILFSIFFVFSSIGFPFSVHYCSDMKEISLSSCKKCQSHEKKIVKSCCAKKNQTKTNSASVSSHCCTEISAAQPISDSYTSSKTSIVKLSFLTYYETPTNYTNFVSNQTKFSPKNDSSPPFLDESDIYISNSILLI